MANELRCPSSGYSYTYSGGSRQGTGNDQAAARADALSKFPPDSESKAKKDAIDDATNDYDCAGACELDVNVGTASFVQTAMAGAAPNITVTVTVQVPVTLSCSQRQVAGTAVIATPVLAEVPLKLPVPGVEVIAQGPTSTIAYVSALQRTMFVATGRIEESVGALGAKHTDNGWMLPGATGVFDLREVDTDPQECAFESVDGMLAAFAPRRGDRRVRENYTCGSSTPGRTGPCMPVGDGSIYIKGSRTPIAYCEFSMGKKCVEFYREVGTVGYYKDKGCTDLLFEFGFNGWTCLGLF